MSLETSRTAFIADQLDELAVFPLFDDDFSIALHPGDAGLRLTASPLDVEDDDYVMTYVREQWTDGGPAAEADVNSATPTPWAPLIPDDVKDVDPSDEDALIDQLFATANAHAQLVELFTTLVASGWHVTVHHVDSKDATTGTPQIRLEAEAPASNADRAETALRALRLPAGLARLEATYGPEGVSDRALWRFPGDGAVAVTAGGERHPVRIADVQTYAVSAAPAWTLHPGIDAPIQRHTAGRPMKGSTLIQPANTPTPHKLRSTNAGGQWTRGHRTTSSGRRSNRRNPLMSSEPSTNSTKEALATTSSSSRMGIVMSASQFLSRTGSKGTGLFARTYAVFAYYPTRPHVAS